MTKQNKLTTMPRNCVAVEYHADDFAMFLPQSRRILDCHYHGNLNGVSVMPNGEDLTACMELLEPVRERIDITVHLNLIEGRCLSEPAAGMTDESGVLRFSFGKLLLQSYLPGRGRCKTWLKEELRTQIRTVASFLPRETPLRLDGHAHYHMIPVVFDAMMDVIREENWNVSYIRIPREYPLMYLRHWKQLQDFSPINLIKVLILNLLAFRNRWKYGQILSKMDQKVFLGVFLSGRMYRENVELLLADACALARKRGWGLEILAHPGSVDDPQNIAKLTNEEDIAFLTDPRRRREAEMFML